MALLTDIVRETAESFGLGNKAGALVAEAIRIMFNSGQGGLGGFLERFDRAGLGELAGTWRAGQPMLRPLDGKQLEAVIGTAAIAEAGRNLGLANARVRTALAFVIPQLTQFFTTGGVVPKTMPQAIETFLASAEARLAAPADKPPAPTTGRAATPKVASTALHPGVWTLGVVILLATGGLTGYQIWKNQQKIQPLVASPRQAVAVEAPAPPPARPEPEPEPGKPGARLTIRNDGGRFEYSGVVSDAGMKANIIEQLLTFYGQARLNGTLAIDPQVAMPGWLSRLDRVLPQLNVPNLDVRLDGNTVKLGGWLSEQDRESVLNSLKTALGPGFRFGYLRDEETELTQDAQALTLAALAALPPGYQGQDLVAALNQWVIPFREGSAAFPDESKTIAARAAELLKTMALPVIVEIGGHTDHQGDGATNQKLTQERASAVQAALAEAGVPPQMMQVKGYGDARPIASNDTPYGRFRNRRIEFSVVQLCDPTHPCGLPEPVVAAPEPVAPVAPVVPPSEEPAATPASAAPDAADAPPKRAKPKAKPKPKPKASASSGAGESSGHDDPEDKPAKATVPKGGRWIPQVTKPATAPARTGDAKAPDAAKPKAALKPTPKPAPAPKPKPASTLDLF